MQSLVFRPTEICRGPNIIQLIFTSLPLCSHLPPSLTLTFMALGYIRFSHKLFKMIYTNVAEAMHRELHWPGSNCYFRSTQESRQCKVGLEEGGGGVRPPQTHMHFKTPCNRSNCVCNSPPFRMGFSTWQPARKTHPKAPLGM